MKVFVVITILVVGRVGMFFVLFTEKLTCIMLKSNVLM